MSAYQSPRSIFEQIADSLELSILNGEPPVGERLLSVRDAASELQVNVNTVVRAYGVLEERGVIRKERGTGYFVSSSAMKKITDRRRKIFFTEHIPVLYRDMQALGISQSELQEHLDAEQEKNTGMNRRI